MDVFTSSSSLREGGFQCNDSLLNLTIKLNKNTSSTIFFSVTGQKTEELLTGWKHWKLQLITEQSQDYRIKWQLYFWFAAPHCFQNRLSTLHAKQKSPALYGSAYAHVIMVRAMKLSYEGPWRWPPVTPKPNVSQIDRARQIVLERPQLAKQHCLHTKLKFMGHMPLLLFFYFLVSWTSNQVEKPIIWTHDC